MARGKEEKMKVKLIFEIETPNGKAELIDKLNCSVQLPQGYKVLECYAEDET